MALPDIPPLGESHSTATVLIPLGSSVLDVGCNYGAFARHLTTKGCEVTGIEIIKELADDAALWCSKVVVGDIETLELSEALAGEKFDIITCLDVLEHLREPAITLRRLGEVLTPGGRIIISIPHIAHAAMRLQLLTGSFNYTQQGLLDRTHLRFFDRAGLEEMLAEAGMRVTDRLYIRRGVTETEIELDWSSISDEVREAASGPDSDIYQFVWAVAPVGQQVQTIGADALWFELELARAEVGRLRKLVDDSPASSSHHVTSPVTPGEVGQLQAALDRAADLEWQLAQTARAMEHRDAVATRARADLEQTRADASAELNRLRGELDQALARAGAEVQQAQARAHAEIAQAADRARAEVAQVEARTRDELQKSWWEIARLQKLLQTERQRLSYRVSNRVIRTLRIQRKGKN